MVVAGLYRRVLPSPPAIEFASPEGKSLFKEALGDGTMEGFFKLISYYQTQSEPAYCGPATLSMVLNALSIDPGRKWKGPWRWFDDSMMDCYESLEKIKSEGITFDKVACLAHCNGANVEAFRTNKSTVDEFRKCVVACSSSEDCHVISSYHRGVFKQTGTGHFSPIGGYHAGRDMVLILDVARFKYPPHWVSLTLLWDAMNTIDDATGQHRGYMIISRCDRAPSILHTAEEVLKLVRETELFKHVSRWLTCQNSLGKEIKSSGENSALHEISAKICCQVAQILAGKLSSADNLSCRRTEDNSERSATTNGFEQVVDMLARSCRPGPISLCAVDQGGCGGMHPSTADVLTVLLLALPEQTWSGIEVEKLREEVISLLTTEHLPTVLQDEVLYLRRQIHFLMTDLEAPKLA